MTQKVIIAMIPIILGISAGVAFDLGAPGTAFALATAALMSPFMIAAGLDWQ